jgi:hypothetical protein
MMTFGRRRDPDMRMWLVLTLKVAETLSNALFGPCEAEQRMLAAREHARILKEFGTTL